MSSQIYEDDCLITYIDEDNYHSTDNHRSTNNLDYPTDDYPTNDYHSINNCSTTIWVN